MSKFDTCHFKS